MRFHVKQYLILTTILVSVPINVFAHGTEEEHQQESLFYETLIDWGFVLSAVLFIAGLVWLFILSRKLKATNVKNQKGQQQVKQLKKSFTIFTFISIVTAVSTFVLGFITLTNNQEEVSVQHGSTDLTHIHGLGYSNDGKAVYIPAHDGLRVFMDGAWSIPEGEQHDYMGFSMVDDGFYSSGHPGPGSKLENPFGVVKSTDMGKTLDILDLYREIDFHGMAVGYYSHAIYVLNPEPNSRMDDTGLHYTLDDTKTWTKSNMKGLEGQAASIAVHQKDERIVAIGTNQGAFLSTDYGDTFDPILPDVPTSAVSFTTNNQLLVGAIEDGPVLYQIDLDSKEKSAIPMPDIGNQDALTYVAVNPRNESELVFTTFDRDVYLTEDNGTNWIQIADKGKAIEEESH
jgi:hypothetical protein